MYLGNEVESDFSHVTLLSYGLLGLITTRTRKQGSVFHISSMLKTMCTTMDLCYILCCALWEDGVQFSFSSLSKLPMENIYPTIIKD